MQILVGLTLMVIIYYMLPFLLSIQYLYGDATKIFIILMLVLFLPIYVFVQTILLFNRWHRRFHERMRTQGLRWTPPI